MIITISNPKIKDAINLVSTRACDEKRVLSPDPQNEPYWHHLVRVYYWLVQKGESDIPTLLAAILHDSVEDEHVTIEEIKEIFGNEVAELVFLLSEEIYSDHNSNEDRAYYFQEIDDYSDTKIRLKALKIKVADRYDNLIGLSFTDFEKKKEQYRREVDQFFRRFASEAGMEEYINEGLAVLNGETKPPDISVELNFSEFDEVKIK